MYVCMDASSNNIRFRKKILMKNFFKKLLYDFFFELYIFMVNVFLSKLRYFRCFCEKKWKWWKIDENLVLNIQYCTTPIFINLVPFYVRSIECVRDVQLEYHTKHYKFKCFVKILENCISSMWLALIHKTVWLRHVKNARIIYSPPERHDLMCAFPNNGNISIVWGFYFIIIKMRERKVSVVEITFEFCLIQPPLTLNAANQYTYILVSYQHKKGINWLKWKTCLITAVSILIACLVVLY